jgi:16S rRNA (cytidine1402-2'-O)-methyltransferase
MKSGRLYLIPTLLAPDTQAEVLPAALPEKIKELRIFLTENERTARRFISSLKLGVNIEELSISLLDKDTKAAEIEPIFKLILQGYDAGVISEAGCPGVADPGALAVAIAHKKGIEVIPLVGPSSILLALMGSGFNGQSFTFHGYLPIEKADRIKSIKLLERDAQAKAQTQIFIETPYRNNALLADIIANCNGNTQLCIAADLTAPTQFIKTLPVHEWKKITLDLNKRPTVFLIF